jgi:hypothetical protein
MSTTPTSRYHRLVAWLSLDDKPTAIAMGLVIFYYFITWGPWQGKASGDGWFGFLYLKSIYYFHTLDMRQAAPEYFKFFGDMGPGHHMPNRCPFGPVILWLPFYLLVAIPESILLALGVLKHATWNGQSPVHVWVTGLSTLCAVLIGWRATFALMRRHLPLPAARLGALCTVCLTPLLWYTCHQPFYQHGIAFGCIALYFEHWDRTHGQYDVRRFVVSGLLLGYAAAVRAQEIVYVLPIAIELIVGMLRGPRRLLSVRGALVSTLAFALAFSPQALVWLYYSGKIAPVQAEPIRWREPWPLVVLFSTRAGLFPWTPLAFVGTVGIALGLFLRGATGRLMRGFGFAFAVGFYVVACAWVVPGAYAFGARRLSDAMGLVGLGVGLVYARLERPRARRLLVGFVGLCLFLELGQMELLRERKIASPGSQTRSLAIELERLHAPSSVVSLAAHVGWPFTQPEEAVWSLYHHATPAVFETVFGDLLLERDGQWLTLLTRTVDLTRPGRFHVAEGMVWPTSGAGQVIGPVRIPLHLFATEAVSIQVVGQVGGSTATMPTGAEVARWNGAPVPAQWQGGGLAIPHAEARAGYNELELALPLGSTLARLELTPQSTIKRPTFPRRAPSHARARQVLPWGRQAARQMGRGRLEP